MGARWYDAVDAVFASYDPLGFGGGQNNLSEYLRQRPDKFGGPKRDGTYIADLG